MTPPVIRSYFDPATWTFTHLVHDPETRQAAVIDSVLNFDPKSGRTSTASVDALIAQIHADQLDLAWILETHAHADHLSAAPILKRALGGKVAIGRSISTVQKVFKDIFNLESTFATDGSQFDVVFSDGDTFQIGQIQVEVMHVPGHTPADSAYRMGSNVFVGDTLFMPDVGTARCDFPGGDARVLYTSIQRLLALPDETVLHMCHDYPPNGSRPVRSSCTVAEQRRDNIHVHDGISQQAFVDMRTARDQTLDMPNLILQSVQVNVRAGEFPPEESNGLSYLKIPLNAL